MTARAASWRRGQSGPATRPRVLSALVFLAATLSLPESAAAQQALPPGDTVMVTPHGRYPAGPFHRWVLGNGHRELWATPVPARVLDLESFAGGLTPLQTGGGQQTRSLRLQGADGVVYNFRSIDKDAARTLDPILQLSLAADILQDQVASLFPLSSMVVAPLLDAAGVFHPQPQLVVLPDHPSLGEFREAFAGLLGWIEIRPDEGAIGTVFATSDRVVSTPRLFERIESGSDNLVDQESFLRARLMDFLVGDWDRHPDQWRWIGFDREVAGRSAMVFEPIPRDRDWAMARLDGVFTNFSWIPWPQYTGFSAELPRVFRISWNGRGLDRRYLNQLDREAFIRTATELRSLITDSVIHSAVRGLPTAYYDQVGAEFEAALMARRDGLIRMAEDYYALLSGWVDVDATDEDEWIQVERRSDGDLVVQIFDIRDDEPRPEPWYSRRFTAAETREVRLYLRGGDDRLAVTGDGPATIVLRVIGGGGDDELIDGTDGAGVRLYDHRGDNTFVAGSRTVVDERDYDAPHDPASEEHGARSRDWGSRWVPLPAISYASNAGLIVGLGAQRTGYGFRQFPWANQLNMAIGVGMGSGRVQGSVDYDVGLIGGRLRNRTSLVLETAEARRFYGYGNGTAAPLDDDLYKAERTQITFRSDFYLRTGANTAVTLGTLVEANRPWENAGTLVAERQPYGYSKFEQIGVAASMEYDTRINPTEPEGGVLFRAEVRGYPELLDLTSPFGTAEGEFRGYLAADAPGQPTLAIRTGGRKVFGTAPYHSAAYLGGQETVRGFPSERFAGDAMAYGGAEVRVGLTDFFFLLPGKLGACALADAGRVFLSDTPADDGSTDFANGISDLSGGSPRLNLMAGAGGDSRWHHSLGGGIWINWLDFTSLSLALANSREGTSFYLTMGMQF